jgi:hypothetical protein
MDDEWFPGCPMFFQPKRVEPDFQPTVASPEFVLALANRIADQSELLSRRADKIETEIPLSFSTQNAAHLTEPSESSEPAFEGIFADPNAARSVFPDRSEKRTPVKGRFVGTRVETYPAVLDLDSN